MSGNRRKDRGARRSNKAASRSSGPQPAQHVSFARLNPNPGPWSLRWDLVDRDGPFPWPDAGDDMYSELAGFLARLNEESLHQVMFTARTNGNSAVHALAPEGLSEVGQAQLDKLYKARDLDSGDYGDIELISMDYCLHPHDPRRVVLAFNAPDRRMYPLWWDPRHEVSGSDGRESPAAGACHSGDCYHRPGA